MNPTDILREGELRYLVERQWYEALLNYEKLTAQEDDGGSAGSTGADGDNTAPAPPGALSNLSLVVPGTADRLRADLEDTDYAALTEPVWSIMTSKHGSSGPTVVRPVVVRDKRPEVELFPLTISFCRKNTLAASSGVSASSGIANKKRKSEDGAELHSVRVGENWTVNNLLAAAATHMRTVPKNVRMSLASDFPDLKTEQPIPDVEVQDRNKKLGALGVVDGDVVLLEAIDEKLVERDAGELIEEEEEEDVMGNHEENPSIQYLSRNDSDGFEWSSEHYARGQDRDDYAQRHTYNYAFRDPDEEDDAELLIPALSTRRRGLGYRSPEGQERGMSGSAVSMIAFDSPPPSERGGRSTTRTDTPEKLQSDPDVPFGMCGLRNLGNTCYMNAGLQCIACLPHVADYFISDEYLRDINRDNPLGWKGELAEEFAFLLKKLWSWRKYASVSPTNFKHLLGKINPQFRGYSQQDSQEFLAFLLDGLHEDLNRVTNKPATEKVDGNAFETAEAAAEEAWRRHLLRNDSLLVHLCQGLYRSTLTCTACGKCSVTFDPYMNLSLPVPVKSDTLYTVFFVPLEGDIIHAKLLLPKKTTFAALKMATAELFHSAPERLFVWEVFHNKFWSDPPEDTTTVFTSVSGTEVYGMYELNPITDGNASKASTSSNQLTETTCSICVEDCDLDSLMVHPGCDARGTCLTCLESYSKGEVSDDEYRCPMCLGGVARSHWRACGVPISDAGFSSFVIRQPVLHIAPGEYGTSLIGVPFIINVQKKGALGAAIHEQIRRHLLGRKVISAESENKTYEVFFFETVDDAKELSYSKTSCFAVEDSVEHEIDFPKGSVLGIVWRQEAMQTLVDAVVRHESMDLTSASGELTLVDCLERFAKVELLGPDDTWYCTDCKELKQASKHMEVWSRPDYLVIQLKRFHVAQGFYFREKIDCMVDYPFELDMTPFIAGPQRTDADSNIYKLVGVVNHMGGMGGGHYTAYTNNPCDGSWIECNDASVDKVPKSEVISRNAYVLFYQRVKSAERNPDLLGYMSVLAETRPKSASPPPRREEPSASPLALEYGCENTNDKTFVPVAVNPTSPVSATARGGLIDEDDLIPSRQIRVETVLIDSDDEDSRPLASSSPADSSFFGSTAQDVFMIDENPLFGNH